MSLRRKPKKKSADNFISGAENSGSANPATKDEVFPWEEAGVRDDVLKNFLLRLPEPAWLKLKYIAVNTPDSMQAFCLKHVLAAIDEKLNDMV